MQGYQLVNCDLRNIDLVNRGAHEGYQLTHSDLYHCDLRGGHLFNLDLSHSSLMKTNLKGANLHNTNLSNANILGAVFDKTRLDGVTWGKKVPQEKLANKTSEPQKKCQLFNEAEEISQLKNHA